MQEVEHGLRHHWRTAEVVFAVFGSLVSLEIGIAHHWRNEARRVLDACCICLRIGTVESKVEMEIGEVLLQLQEVVEERNLLQCACTIEVVHGALTVLILNAVALEHMHNLSTQRSHTGTTANPNHLSASAILRADGDTRRPLVFMVIAGVVNIMLNLFFVVLCKMDVAGVALAAMIGSSVSAFLVMRVLLNTPGCWKLEWKKLKFHWDALKEMLKIGLPAGMQGAMFSISNITIQSAVNSFGWQAIAGNTAALSLEGIVYVACSSYYYTAISFAGQNHGAGRIDRVIKSVFYCALCTSIAATVLGWSCFLGGRTLLGFYNSDPEAIQWGMIRLRILFTSYFLCGLMDVVSGSLRGLGHSFKPMLVIMMGVCGLRVVWVFWILPCKRTMETLMVSYPVSWILVILINGAMLFYICRKMLKQQAKGR